MSDRNELQKAIYEFVTTWHEGMDLQIEGEEIGQCLEYQLTQILNRHVIDLLLS